MKKACGKAGLLAPSKVGFHEPVHKIRLTLQVYSGPNRTGKLLGTYVHDIDEHVLQSLQCYLGGLEGVTGLSVKNTSGTAQSQTGPITAGTPVIEFGTGTTAAAWTDFAIQTAAGGTNPVTATVSSITNGSTSGSYTITATWNNTTGGSVTISELAHYVTTTAGFASAQTFCFTHDVFTGVAVSNGGSAAATLTDTWS